MGQGAAGLLVALGAVERDEEELPQVICGRAGLYA